MINARVVAATTAKKKPITYRGNSSFDFATFEGCSRRRRQPVAYPSRLAGFP